MKPNSFIFLGDILEIKGQTLHLFDDYKIKKPNRTQLGCIKEYVERSSKFLFFNVNRYEHEKMKREEGGYTYVPLEEPYWKYLIVEHKKKQMSKNFPLILGLSELDLTILFEASFAGGFKTNTKKNVPSIMFRELRTINFFRDNSLHLLEKKLVTKVNIQELKKIHSSIISFGFQRKKFVFIEKALDDFLKLSDISEESPFKILSYFSIFELLLTTYKPRGSSDNSINFQLRKKINLLNNQFEEKINFKNFFQGANTNNLDTILSKLYQYRNNIAHGNISNFEKDLHLLKNNQDGILIFLRTLLKKILIFSLKSPQLVKDLKDC